MANDKKVSELSVATEIANSFVYGIKEGVSYQLPISLFASGGISGPLQYAVFPSIFGNTFPRGVTGIQVSNTGINLTNGTFNVFFSNGSISGANATFTVANNRVASINVISAGLNQAGGANSPNVLFNASTNGLTANAVGNIANVGILIPSMGFYWVVSTDGAYLQLYQNQNYATPNIISNIAVPTYTGSSNSFIQVKKSLDYLNFTQAEIDSGGNLIWGVDKNLGPIGGYTNLRVIEKSYTLNTNNNIYVLNDDYVIYCYLIFGQSWAAGQNQDGTDSTITTSAIDPSYALMLSEGPLPTGNTSNGLVDLYEKTAAAAKQTVASSFANTFNSRLFAATGKKVKIVMTGAALSSTPYKGIKKSTATWAELTRVIREVRDYANKLGYRVVFPGVLYLEGASDAGDSGTGGTLNRQRLFLDQLQRDLEELINSINPQPEPVLLFTTVADASAVNGALYKEVPEAYAENLRNSKIRCCGPMYWLYRGTTNSGAGDGLHPSSVGYYQWGEMFAEAALTEIFGLPNGPLYPVEWWRSGANTFDIKMSMNCTIDLSNTTVNVAGLGTGLGIRIGTTANIINSNPVNIISVTSVPGPNPNITNTIRVTLEPPTIVGYNLTMVIAQYFTGSGNGPQTGARSAFRSTDAFANSRYDGKALYHWCLPSRLTFSDYR